MAATFSTSGDDTLDGGGTGTISYGNAASGVTVSLLLQGTAQDTIGDGVDTLTSFVNLNGSTFNDVLTGDGSDNILIGGLGNDSLDGGAGIDTAFYAASASAITLSLALQGTAQITGGAGTDTLVNFENLMGSLYDDVLSGDDGDNVIDGGAAGRDLLSGGLGTDTLIGGSGVDMVSYAYAAGGVTVSLDNIDFQEVQTGDSDKLIGIEGLIGSAFDDVLTGNNLANSLYGGNGDDLINGAGSNDVIDGGAGNDTIDYSANGDAMRVNLSITASQHISALGGNDTISNVENVIGSAFEDRITGDSHDNHLYGGSGDDILDGGLGTNILDGGDGYDMVLFAAATSGVTVDLLAGTVTGGSSETLISISDATGTAFDDALKGTDDSSYLFGGAGSDLIQGGLGNDLMDGGTGIDTLSFSSFGGTGPYLGTDGIMHNDGAFVDLSLITPQDTNVGFDTFRGFENLVGSDFDDILAGSQVDNVIYGGAGYDLLDGGARNDTLYGGSESDFLFGNLGNDILYGGDGDDDLVGYDGNDQLFGGAGSDTADYSYSFSLVVVDLAITTQQNTKGQGLDTLTGIENLFGSAWDDKLLGDGGDNHITGFVGSDTLTGRGGADTFVYTSDIDSTVCGCFGTDLITDFSANDVLDLSAVDADYNTIDDGDPASGTNEAFHIVSAFTGAAGELVLTYDATTNITTLATDTDGDGYGDFGLTFKGDVTSLTTNFIL